MREKKQRDWEREETELRRAQEQSEAGVADILRVYEAAEVHYFASLQVSLPTIIAVSNT
jgi:hypothetical protein